MKRSQSLNVETWIHYLQGEEVDEEKEDYPKFKKKSICKPLVKELAVNRNHALHEDAPSSLKSACKELHRIL